MLRKLQCSNSHSCGGVRARTTALCVLGRASHTCHHTPTFPCTVADSRCHECAKRWSGQAHSCLRSAYALTALRYPLAAPYPTLSRRRNACKCAAGDAWHPQCWRPVGRLSMLLCRRTAQPLLLAGLSRLFTCARVAAPRCVCHAAQPTPALQQAVPQPTVQLPALQPGGRRRVHTHHRTRSVDHPCSPRRHVCPAGAACARAPAPQQCDCAG